MARPNFVKKARKDIAGTDIKAGDSYWWWSFRFGGKRYSKTQPKRSQLTQSSFYSQIYDLEDRGFSGASLDDLESERDEMVADLENLRDECQSSLDNMPDSLQYSPTGELLQARIDGLESTADQFQSVDFDFDDNGDTSLEDFIEDKRNELSDVSFEYE